MAAFSNAEKASEAAREAQMRRAVYARHPLMTKQEAAKRIAIMEEIAAEYRRLDQPELL